MFVFVCARTDYDDEVRMTVSLCCTYFRLYMRPCHGQGCWGLLLGLRGASIDDKRRIRHGISRRAASSRCWFPYGRDLDLWVRDLDRGKGEGRGIGDLHRGVRVDGDLLKVDRAARFHPRPPFSWGHAALVDTIGWWHGGEHEEPTTEDRDSI